MGFMDKLKKAAEQATQKATEVVERATKAAEPFVSGVVDGLSPKPTPEAPAATKAPQQAETPKPEPLDPEAERAAREAKKAEQAAKREERLEKLRAEVRKYAELPSNCDKGMGDCVMGYENFCYTCPVDCECRRKQMVPTKLQYPILNPDFLPYAKWEEAALKKIYKDIPAGDRTDKAIRDWCSAHTDPFRKIWNTFFQLVLPGYGGRGYEQLLSESMKGFGTKNKLLTFLVRAYDCKLKPSMFGNISGVQISAFSFIKEIDYDFCVDSFDEEDFDFVLDRHIDLDFYYNPSLYRRNNDDFHYTVEVLEILHSPEVFGHFFPNLEFDPEKWMKMMIDKKGNIKPAGRGGPAQGEWGDTIYNAVEELQRLNDERG